MKRPRLLSRSLAEFLGTFAILFFGCGAIHLGFKNGEVAVIFGLTVAFMIYAVGHISGAHFNPAVTLAFAAARHFPLKEVLAYGLAQVLGATAAVALLAGTLPNPGPWGVTSPSIPLFPALIWETALTFFLMFVIVSVATDTRAVGTMAGAAIGATVMVGAWVGGPLTNASMNPARSLGPALVEGRFENLWIYFVGPTLGAVLAALLYEDRT
jgi:MIP family channel proteins